MAAADLTNITVTPHVSAETGEAFCVIEATGAGSRELRGQMTVAEVRGWALQWLRIAESADQEAALRRVAKTGGLPQPYIDSLVGHVRAALSDHSEGNIT